MARKRLIQKQKEIGSGKILRRFFVFAFSVLAMSLGFYIFSINSLASKGHDLRRAEDTISDLSEEYRNLQIQAAQLSALDHVEQIGGELDLKRPEDVRYVKETGPVALR